MGGGIVGGGLMGGASGALWEASGRHLEGALGGQGDDRRPRGVVEEKVVKTYVFYHQKLSDRPFRLDETRATLTKYCKN